MTASEPRPRVQAGREPDLLTYIWNLANFNDLRGHPQKVLDAIDKYNTEEKRLINIGPKKGVLIDKLIEEKKPSVMIELGGYVGYSAIRFGDALRRAGGKKYYSLEINPINASVAKMLVELSGLQDVVSIIVAPSHEALGKMVEESLIEFIEVLFVDHWEDRYLCDLWLVERLGLLRGGVSVVVADNISPGAERGTEYVTWLNSSMSEKENILEKRNFGIGADVDLVKVIKEKGVRDCGVDLGNVPGVPGYVYETKLHEFSGHSGRTDGVAITNVL